MLGDDDSELHRWTGGFDFLKCQTFAASPAEPGELLFWFRLSTIESHPTSIEILRNGERVDILCMGAPKLMP
jgi:hypothetical protein